MSNTSLARLAGGLYLLLAIAGGFAHLGARGAAAVAGDASATADNIRSSATLFGIGFVADIVNIALFVATAFVLYVILSPVHQKASAAFVVLASIAAAIIGADLINHAGAMVVATDPAYATALGADAADALAALFLDLHGFGYLVAQTFFGAWLFPLGYVVYRSGWFPRVIGIGLMAGAFGYLGASVVTFLTPGFEETTLALLLAWPAGIAEIAFLLWLLIRGVRDTAPVPNATSPAAAAAAA